LITADIINQGNGFPYIMVKLNTWQRSKRLFAFLLLFLSASSQIHGQAVRVGPVEACLAAEQTSVQPGRPITVALLLAIDSGWHVYGKNPGDSGIPTTMEWDLPSGFSMGPVQWPVPERIVSAGLVTYGYSRQVMLMAEITPPKQLQPATNVKIYARVRWLACRVECMPGSADLKLSLPVGFQPPQTDSRWVRTFAQTRKLLPQEGNSGVFSAEAGKAQVTLKMTGFLYPKGTQVLFYPDAVGQFAASSPQVASDEGGSLKLRMQPEQGATAPLRLTGVLVITGPSGTQAFKVDTPVAQTGPESAGFIAAFLLAFVGGLILNLMPCVLPVISLKVISFKGDIRHGLLFALGVLVSFWIIGGILVGLRAGGHLLGWGFQFQIPSVVVVVAVLFFLIGLNLFGVFEVGVLLTGVGGAVAGHRKSGGASSLLSGVFATVVATPCTAPFMGAALGYALTHSLEASFGVFSALALGMAAPYLLLSFVPELVRRLPKPGPWMETFRQLMAFPMMAAAVWMVSVLAALVGATAVVLVLCAMLAAGIGAWIWGRWGSLSRQRFVRATAACVALLFAVGGTAIAAGLVSAGSPTGGGRAGSDSTTPSWERWSQARVEELRQKGTPVFLDFTARWCLSCQVNEKVALDNAEVRKRFQQKGIVILRADWTDSNDAIARGLATFGRASVPLYVFYPRGATEPVILPELLTPPAVLAAIGQ
jgi:thiol:disulfide interchange protein DsbD